MHREAAMSYRRLITSIDSPSAEDLCRLGYAHMQAGEFLSATEAFANAHQADPVHTKASLYLGHVLAQRGETQEAHKVYQIATKAASSSPEPHAALADLYMNALDFDKTGEEFATALELGERSVAVHYNYLLTLLRIHEPDKAVPADKNALQDHPMELRLRCLLDRLTKEATLHHELNLNGTP